MTPLEALASVHHEEDAEEDYTGDRWTAARSTLIAKSATVKGADRVRVAGDAVIRAGAEIRGDTGQVAIGRYVDVGCGVTIEGGASVASHALVLEKAAVQACAIGVGCVVGRGAIIGEGAVVKDYCLVASGAVVAAGAVLAPFSIVAGAPAMVLGRTTPAWADDRRRRAELGAARRRAAI